MKRTKTLLIPFVCLLFLIGAMTAATQSQSVAATTLTGSMIEEIDSDGLKITVQIAGGGERLSIPVANAEVIKGVTVGDRVNLELDPQGKVVKIVKITPKLREAPEPRG